MRKIRQFLYLVIYVLLYVKNVGAAITFDTNPVQQINLQYQEYQHKIGYASHPYMSSENRAISSNIVELSATPPLSTITPNTQLKFKIEMHAGSDFGGGSFQTDPNYGRVFISDRNQKIGYLIKINNKPIIDENNLEITPTIKSDGSVIPNASVQIKAVDLTNSETTFSTDYISFKLYAITDTDPNRALFYYKVSMSWAFKEPYISSCNLDATVLPEGPITLEPISPAQLNSGSGEQFAKTFTLKVNNCQVVNAILDKDDFHRNDVEQVYVTFHDAYGDSIGATILKNGEGDAKGVGLQIKPLGSSQPIKYTPDGTKIYGYKDNNDPRKSDGQATAMNTIGTEATIGEAEKTFKVYYVKDPSQGNEIIPGSVVGKVTFTFSYQ